MCLDTTHPEGNLTTREPGDIRLTADAPICRKLQKVQAISSRPRFHPLPTLVDRFFHHLVLLTQTSVCYRSTQAPEAGHALHRQADFTL